MPTIYVDPSVLVGSLINAIEIGARTFWTFDGRQRALARQAGMTVNP
jgi:hypothetical protein